MKHNENELAKNQEKKVMKETADKTNPNYHKEVSQAIEDQELENSDEPEF